METNMEGSAPVRTKAGRKPGYVYFLFDGDRDAIKIGHAVDPGVRLSTLQTGNPNKLGFLEVFRGSRNLEGALHKRFHQYRLFGEWFRESAAIRDFLERVEDYQLGFWCEHFIAQGRRDEFAAAGYPWHDLDIPEEVILAMAPPLPPKVRKKPATVSPSLSGSPS